MRDVSDNRMQEPDAGMLLLAHPGMSDPNFAKAVIFLTAHADEEGSAGVVINRPLGRTLVDIEPNLADSPLAGLPLYRGGPVASDKVVLAAWKWVADDGSFRFFFGIDREKAIAIQEQDADFHVCGFLGHSGWGEGQLTAEIAQGAWLLSRQVEGLDALSAESMWRELLCRENPAMRVLIDAPDDPSVN